LLKALRSLSRTALAALGMQIFTGLFFPSFAPISPCLFVALSRRGARRRSNCDRARLTMYFSKIPGYPRLFTGARYG
jgi:hypothetical protein